MKKITEPRVGTVCGHPIKRSMSRGLCDLCYTRQWRTDNPEKVLAHSRQTDARRAMRRKLDIEWRKATNARRLERHKRLKATNPEFYKARAVLYTQNWQTKNPERAKEIRRRAMIKGTYGISADEYDRLIAECNGICPMCKEPTTKWCMDHCHQTDRVRGPLCITCNQRAGWVDWARSNPFDFMKFSEYCSVNSRT